MRIRAKNTHFISNGENKDKIWIIKNKEYDILKNEIGLNYFRSETGCLNVLLEEDITEVFEIIKTPEIDFN